jgi:hypothetical protein
MGESILTCHSQFTLNMLLRTILIGYQNTKEEILYDLVASRIATELMIELSCMSRSLVVDLRGPTWMLDGNMSVVLNASAPSRVSKKKHNAIAYCCVRKVITTK